MVRQASLELAPFVFAVRCLTVAKGGLDRFVVLRWRQCSVGKRVEEEGWEIETEVLRSWPASDRCDLEAAKDRIRGR